MAAGRPRVLTAAVLVAALLAGCGGDSGADGDAITGSSGGDVAIALAPPGLRDPDISLPTSPPTTGGPTATTTGGLAPPTSGDDSGISTPETQPVPTVQPPPDDGDGNDSNPANGARFEDLWGQWEAKGTDPQYGPVTAWYSFGSTGYEFTISMPQVQYTFTMSGGLEFDPVPKTLTLDIDDYAPRQWCGPLGCNPIVMPSREYDRFDFKDADHVVITSVDCIEPSCEVLYTKTRDG